MENKAQLSLAIMSAIFVFIVGMLMLNFLMPEVTDFRTNLHCDDYTTISDGTKLLCLAGDSVIPYFIWTILSIAVGVILVRLAI